MERGLGSWEREVPAKSSASISMTGTTEVFLWMKIKTEPDPRIVYGAIVYTRT